MFIGLLLLVQVATLSLTNYLGARIAGERFLPALAAAQARLEAEIAERRQSLQSVARTLLRSPGLAQAVAAGRWEEALRSVRPGARKRAVDLVLLFDGEGRLRQASEPVSMTDSDRVPADSSKGAGDRYLSMLDAEGRPVVVVLEPFEGTGSRNRLGVGRRLDPAIARNLGGGSGLVATAITRSAANPWRIAWTTDDDRAVPQLTHELATEMSPAAMLAGFSPFDLRTYEVRKVTLPVLGGEAAIVVRQSLGEALAPFETLRTAVTIVTVIGMVVFLVGARLIAASISRPVRELAKAARRIREGDYEGSIPARGPVELVELSRSLESMREEIARREGEVRRLAYFDSLTGLANRALFGQALRDAVKSASAPSGDPRSQRFAVLLLDLDRFKWVNDTLGHESGDRVLAVAAERLRDALPEGPMVARLGGDEFAVLVSGAQRPVHEIAERIGAALEPPILIARHTVDVGASIGIAHFPEHGTTPDELMRHADSAMYIAKRHGLPSAVFDPALETSRVRHLSMLSDLRAALEKEEIELYVQPRVSLSGDVPRLGGEVLVRWQHPDRGMLLPADFVPFAEETGFIRNLTLYLVQRAIWQGARWLREGLEVTLSVNISARDLDDRSLVQRIGRWLAAEALPARLLCLEITETALLEEPERAVTLLRELRTMGVQIAIDDYGTGFSSLAYLKTLWVSELKIDQSFVRGMSDSERNTTIVRSTIELGHSLGLKVTAEGVEGELEASMLRGFGCDEAQGHYYSPPLARHHFEQWAREHLAAAASLATSWPTGSATEPSSRAAAQSLHTAG